MPRTKQQKKTIAKTARNKIAQALVKDITKQRDLMKQQVQTIITDLVNKNDAHLKQKKLTIPQNVLSKTGKDLKNLPNDWSGNFTTLSSTLLDSTKNLTTVKKKRGRRSLSCADDDGYLTAESSQSTSASSRESRTRTRIAKTERKSRSQSTKKTTVNVDKYKTPANNRIVPNSYGTVTPKVKPNTPQVILRRANVGEMAWSNQGSPLLTAPVLTEQRANINIPLDDGRLLSIQPERGLRKSQIPNIAPGTLRELSTLLENLNKVCALAKENVKN